MIASQPGYMHVTDHFYLFCYGTRTGIGALIRSQLLTSAMTSSSITGFTTGSSMVTTWINIEFSNGPKLIETPDIKKSVILNGWIYALWGLREAAVKTKRSDILNFIDDTTNCLVDSLSDFYDDRWSYYDDKGRIASPFYYRLHITQLSALYKMTASSVQKCSGF